VTASAAPFRERLASALAEAGVQADIRLTNNRVSMLSVRRREGRLVLRIARPFASFDEEAIAPIVAFIKKRPEGRRQVRALLKRIPEQPRRPRRVRLRTKGVHHDLTALLADAWTQLRDVVGDGETDADADAAVNVTWGPRRRLRRGQRHLRMGSYEPGRTLVRIHHQLDHAQVPGWFVSFVLYHELLHHRLGVPDRGSRQRVHTREFRRLEALHPVYDQAMAWERDNLTRLLAGRL
jgi:hypothetical protein